VVYPVVSAIDGSGKFLLFASERGGEVDKRFACELGVTNQRPSDPYCRFVESKTASSSCDWPVLQTTTWSTGWAAVVQGGQRMVCLPQSGLPLFHRLPSNQSANLRSELLPSPSKYASAGSMDDASNGRTARALGHGVFTPSRYPVLSLLFSGSQPASKKGAESLFSAHSLTGLNWTTGSGRTTPWMLQKGSA